MNIVEAAEKALEKPSDFGWWGRDDMFTTWGWSGIAKHRDSDLLQISNFDFISNDLMSKYEDDFEIVGMGHWAVGHVDQLIVRIIEDVSKPLTEENITDAFKDAWDWVSFIENDYPIASENHYYSLVSEKVFEYTKQNLPDQIHIGSSIDETVSDILEYLEQEESYDYDDTVPYDEDMLMAAYFLRLCSYSEREFWDEFVDKNSLAAIKWDDITEYPSGVPIEIPGQMSIIN